MNRGEVRGRLTRLRSNRDLRRLGACIFGMLTLALVTGPEGLQGNPTYGFTESLLQPRVLGFLVAAVVLWAMMTSWGRLSGPVRAKGSQVTEIGRQVFERRLLRS